MGTGLDDQRIVTTEAAWLGAVLVFFTVSWLAAVSFSVWVLVMGCQP